MGSRMIDSPGTLYLLHFSQPLGDVSRPRMSAQHYLGWCARDELERRLAEHRAGCGAKITRAAVNRGIRLLHVWQHPGTPADERTRKQRGHFSTLCPVCTSQGTG